MKITQTPRSDPEDECATAFPRVRVLERRRVAARHHIHIKKTAERSGEDNLTHVRVARARLIIT